MKMFTTAFTRRNIYFLFFPYCTFHNWWMLFVCRLKKIRRPIAVRRPPGCFSIEILWCQLRIKQFVLSTLMESRIDYFQCSSMINMLDEKSSQAYLHGVETDQDHNIMCWFFSFILKYTFDLIIKFNLADIRLSCLTYITWQYKTYWDCTNIYR